MKGYTIFFLLSGLILLVLFLFFVTKDIKRKKKPMDIFISNIEWFFLFLVCIGVVSRSFLTASALNMFNQILLIFITIFVVLPLIFILLFYVKSDIKKWNNPKEYKYYWAYKIRYVLIGVLVIMFVGALYKFYLIYRVVFV